MTQFSIHEIVIIIIIIIIVIIIIIIIIERFSIEWRKTKTKPIINQLDHSANLDPEWNQNHSSCLITLNTQMKTAVIIIGTILS